MKKRFALIGHPLGHSLSPEIHRAIMEQTGVDGTYELLDIPPADLPARLPVVLRDFDGFNTTIPHKIAVIPYLGGLSDAARRCGAVNTVFQGRGYNTDAAAFLSAGLPLAGSRTLLVGNGGVAATMAAETVAAGAAELIVATRSAERGTAFVDALRDRFPDSPCAISAIVGDGALVDFLARSTVLLNGTPLGMWPHAGGCPVPPGALPSAVTAFDPVYNPTPSRLVLAVRKAGGRAVGGLRMLVRQAVAAQQIWNPGLSIDADVLVDRLLPELVANLYRKNPVKLLLVGFMGAGKTSVGRALAARLGLPFADLDEEIVEAAGRPIPAIFADSGEAAFRELETNVARAVLSRPCSEVIASGGGFPTFATNRALVRETNTLVVAIEAPFETLWTRIAGGSGRPLARQRGDTAALHARRAPVYRDFCDIAVETTDALRPEDVAARIQTLLAP